MNNCSFKNKSRDDLPILKGLLQYGIAPNYPKFIDFKKLSKSKPVRFGRVPKREKARIMAAMHNVKNQSLQKNIMSELDDEYSVVNQIVDAYMNTCEYTKMNIQKLRIMADTQPKRSYNPKYPSCPIFPSDGEQSNFSIRFSKAIRGIINFAMKLPTFSSIPTEDRMLLLKNGAFEALLVSLSRLYDGTKNSFLCMDGRLMEGGEVNSDPNTPILMGSMCSYSIRMNELDLSDQELALFTAIVIITPNRPGIRCYDLIYAINKKLKNCLQNYLLKNKPNNPKLYEQLLTFIDDLKALNVLHSDKFFSEKAKTSGRNWEESSRSSWEEKDSCFNSPTSSCSVESPMKSPESLNGELPRCMDGSMYEHNNSMMECAPSYMIQNSEPSEGSSSGDEAIDIGMKCPFISKRKVDSPNDSGFESDKISLPSICSSPRSSIDEKIEEEREEYMPVLRRALQAPPIMNTDLMMAEAYKPHKKFRAFRKEEEVHSSSSILAQPLSPHPISSSTSSLLASALSSSRLSETLFKSPNMSEEVLKEADRIHTLMVKKESHFQRNNRKSQKVSPAPYFSPISVRERFQPLSPNWSSTSCSSSSESITSQSRYHLLTTPSPSRYHVSSTPLGPGCQSSHNHSNFRSRSPSSSTSQLMQLQVDIADSQPLNLSKKTPPPQAFMVEA